MHIESVGEADPTEHGITALEFQALVTRGFDGDAPALYGDDRCQCGIVQAAFLVVGGPADRVALIDSDRFEVGEFETATGDAGIDLLGIEAQVAPVGARQLDLAVVEDAADLILPAP